MMYKLPSGKEAMAESKTCIKGEASANSTKDSTVASPFSNQLIDSRPVERTMVELSKDEDVAVHVSVSEDVNVFSDSSDAYSNVESDADNYILFKKAIISDLKKEKAELEEKLKHTKEEVSSVEHKLAQEEARIEKLRQFMKVVANQGGIRGTYDIDLMLKD